MRVLIACEFSGIVRDAFIAAGHDAVSCDLLPTESEGPHIQGDVLSLLGDGWDMMIAFPPCTYLCSSGLHWNKRRPGREQLTHDAVLFALSLMGEGRNYISIPQILTHNIPRIALENPVGCLSTKYRKPDQIIQPYQFGHDASKQTCLWLKGLPLLQPTQLVPPRIVNGRKLWGNQTPSGQNKLGPSPTRAMDRARTYSGVAAAMAEQWGRA